MNADARSRRLLTAGLLAGVVTTVTVKASLDHGGGPRPALGAVPLPSAPPTSATSSPSPTAAPAAPASTSSPRSTAPATVMRTGPVEMTPYGPIQVRVTITGGRITQVVALQSPSSRSRSVAIAEEALPQLAAEVIRAQSANIDAVSGASYDSAGYARSLQAALDGAAP